MENCVLAPSSEGDAMSGVNEYGAVAPVAPVLPQLPQVFHARVSSKLSNTVTTSGVGLGDGDGVGVGDGVAIGVGLGTGSGVGLATGDGVGRGLATGELPPQPMESASKPAHRNENTFFKIGGSFLFGDLVLLCRCDEG